MITRTQMIFSVESSRGFWMQSISIQIQKMNIKRARRPPPTKKNDKNGINIALNISTFRDGAVVRAFFHRLPQRGHLLQQFFQLNAGQAFDDRRKLADDLGDV